MSNSEDDGGAAGDALAPPPGPPLPPGLWEALRRCYETPPRFYHDAAHVSEVARQYCAVERELGWAQPREVYWAVLFHDAVYEVGARDNEARSAALAVEWAARWLVGEHAFCAPGFRAQEASRLIELTARHGALTAADVDDQSARFLDCDMAILGAPPEQYAIYERDVAREYLPHYGEADYQRGRAAFLAGMLARPRIFLSDYFHERLDAQARDNLRSALAGLGD